MSYQNIVVTDEEGISILTISREKSLNALNQQTIEELSQFFREDAPNRTDLKGVIITGAGHKAFVAGADIKGFVGLDSREGAALSASGHAVFNAIEQFPKPVIAAVNGFALGGGCELAMACHLRIAGEKARFGQPEVKLGLVPGYGGTQRLVRYIGHTKAMELLLTGDMIDAPEAHRLGLINQIVPAGEEVAAAKKMLQNITQHAPIAIAQIISTVQAYHDKDTDGFAAEIEAFGYCADTEDFKEGATAFIEKRKANFRNK